MTNNVALYSLYAVSLKISFIESILVSPFGCFMKKNSEKIFPHSKSQKKQFFFFCTRGTKCNLGLYFTYKEELKYLHGMQHIIITWKVDEDLASKILFRAIWRWID
jgi:hypothetical protein